MGEKLGTDPWIDQSSCYGLGQEPFSLGELCIFSFLFRLHILGHGHTEPESEESMETTPAEETNPELTKGKPQCIPPIILDFFFNHYFIL
jgi:hypothetical protein